jgi:HSP20 family molecular chaperone IbpA
VIVQGRHREDSVSKSPARQEPTKLNVLYGEGLGTLERNIQRAIAYRAYDLYSQRGRSHGHDLQDWITAENELVRPQDVQIAASGGEWVIKARAPGFTARELQVGASPRKIIVWAQASRPGSDQGRYPDQLLGEIELPGEAIPETSTAMLSGDQLEVRVAKQAAAEAAGLR